MGQQNRPSARGRRARVRLVRGLIAGAVALTLPASAQAAASNDDWLLPTSIPGLGSPITANTSEATTDPAEPLSAPGSCEGSQMDKTFWYRIAGTGRKLTFDTRGSQVDTVLAVYEAPAGILGNLVGCNNDLGGGSSASEITFPSVAGMDYLVQVGGAAGGPVSLVAYDVPANDDRSAAAPIGLGSTVAVRNAGGTVESGELVDCGGGMLFGRTTWYRFTSAGHARAVLDASGADTVIALFRSSGQRLACNRGGGAGGASITADLTPGDYLVQLGGFGAGTAAAVLGAASLRISVPVGMDLDGDGFTIALGDCDEGSAAVHPGAFDNPDNLIDEDCTGTADTKDRDGDGVYRPLDCDDNNTNIHPAFNAISAATDVPDNGVDEDCNGVDRTDVDGDGARAPADCRDNDPKIRPGAFDVPENGIDEDCNGEDAPNLDRDGDRVNRPMDCNDTTAAIRPGLPEVRGNRVDENCDGVVEPYEAIESTVRRDLQPRKRYATFKRLTVGNVPAGATVIATCRGKRCPSKIYNRRFDAPVPLLSLTGWIARRKLPFGSTVEVRILAPDKVGKIVRFRIFRKVSGRTDLCLPPGATAPVDC